MNLREKIADMILVKGKPDDYGSAFDRADQILSLIASSLQPLTDEEIIEVQKNNFPYEVAISQATIDKIRKELEAQ